jgi:hypothetical protein
MYADPNKIPERPDRDRPKKDPLRYRIGDALMRRPARTVFWYLCLFAVQAFREAARGQILWSSVAVFLLVGLVNEVRITGARNVVRNLCDCLHLTRPPCDF